MIHNDIMKIIELELNKVEEAHIDFFKSRPPLFDSEPHDKLRNHYILAVAPTGITLQFHPNSQLPAQIIEECNAAFQNISIK